MAEFCKHKLKATRISITTYHLHDASLAFVKKDVPSSGYHNQGYVLCCVHTCPLTKYTYVQGFLTSVSVSHHLDMMLSNVSVFWMITSPQYISALCGFASQNR